MALNHACLPIPAPAQIISVSDAGNTVKKSGDAF
jgi:hypothetical protein